MKRQRLFHSPIVYLLWLVLPVLILLIPQASAGAVGATLTATKDDGVPAATRKVGGNTVTYTNTITNTGGTDATGVQFLDPDVTHAGYVLNSLKATPVALNDTYPATVIANTSINTATSGFSVITNDFGGFSGGVAVANTALTISAFDAASTGGGTVSMITTGAGVGQFTYTPAAGFTGTDTFTYTISNGVAGGTAASIKATVSIPVGGPVVWFVDPNSATNGNGTLGSPFNVISSAITAIGANANQRIFIYSIASTLTASIPLNAGGWLVGQAAVGTNFDTLMGVTFSADTPSRPAINNGTRPTITRATGSTVILGNGSNVVGVRLDASGTATALSGAVNAATVGNATNGDVVGISNTGSGAVNIGAGNGSIAINASITTSAGTGVSVASRTGGTVTFSQSIVVSSGTGVVLSNNTGATINFTAGMSLNTGANPAFSATGGGTVSVAAAAGNNTLTTTTGTALNVANTTIGASGLTFRSISAAGGANGIVLNTTGASGGLTVTGDGSNTTLGGNSTGGTISGMNGANGAVAGTGIYLNSTANVTLRRMTVTGTNQNFGIYGSNVTGFTMEYSTVSGTNGNDTPSREGSVIFDNVFGSNSILSSIVSGAVEDNLRVENTTGTLAAFDVTNCTIRNNSTVSGNIGFRFATATAGVSMTGSVTGCTFQGNRTDTINTDASNGTVTINIANNTIIAGTGGNNQGNIGIDVTVANNGVMNFHVDGNKVGTLDGTTGASLLNTGINIFNGTLTTPNPATITGTVKNNIVINDNAALAGSSNGSGIRLFNQGYGTMAANVSGNTVSNVNTDFGIFAEVSSNSGTANAVGTSTVAVTGNTANVKAGALDAIRVQARGRSVMNARINNNVSSGGGVGFFGLEIRQAQQTIPAGGTVFQATFNLEGLTTGLQTVHSTIVNYENSQNPSISLANTDEIHSLGITGVPTISGVPPLLFAPGGIERAAEIVNVPGGAAPWSAVASEARHRLGNVLPVRSRTASAPPAEPSESGVALSLPAALTQDQLDAIVSEARARWEATGLSREQVARLRSLKFEVAALSSNHLGEAGRDAIRVDRDAGGNGWFASADAGSDALFGAAKSATRHYTDPASAPAGRVDLLTTILHEMGHALGLADTYLPQDRESIMFGQLTKGERRLPAMGQAVGAVPFSGDITHYLSGTLNPITIGTLPVGKSVIITYDVQIENPITPNTTSQISSQATIHSTGGAGTFADFTTADIEGAVLTGSGPTATLLAIPPSAFSAQTPPAAGDVGLAYVSYNFVADGIPAPTYSLSIPPPTFTLQSGPLPGGLSLNAAGLLSGTPTTAGTFSNIVVRATNIAGTLDTASFTITIASAVTVSPATMPNWTVNAGGYSQTFAGSNGTGAKTLSLSAGAVPTGMTFVPATGVLSGTPTAAGTFNFTLKATDTLGQFTTQAYTVVINAAIAVSPATLPDWTVNKSGYSQTITNTGGTGASTFSVSAGAIPTGMALSAGGVFNGTPTAAGTFNFTVTATDTVGATGAQAYTVVINPAIAVSPATLPSGQLNAAYSQTVSASGGTGAKTFAVTAGSIPTGTTLTAGGLLSGTATAAGTFNFTITATDTVGATGSQAYSVAISAITITPSTLPNWTVNKTGYSQTLTGGGGTGPYTFAVTAGTLPTGLTLVAGVLSGTPTAANTFNFTITATDNAATSGSQAYTVVINPAIAVSPASVPNWTVNKSGYTQTITKTGGTGASTFAVTVGAIPTGMALSAGGVFNGTPTAAGTFNFTVTATDTVGATGAQAYTVVINAAIAVSPASVPNWTANKSGYSQTITNTGGTGASTFAVTIGAVPTGMTLSSGGLLNGTPTVVNTFNFTVTATDTVGSTGAQAYTVVINPAVTVSPASLPNWTVNQAGYTQTFTSANGTGAKTLAISVGAIPTGMTFTPATGVLNGTPTAAGTFNFTITATDTVGATGAQAYTVVINPAIAVSPASVPNWTVNKSGYSQTITNTGGTGASTLAVTVGAVPTGMTLSSGGLLSGTPTVANTFNFTVTATDTVGATGTQAYTVVINPAVTITPLTLPNATLNQGYSQTVSATGGTGAKTFAVTAGTIPTGTTFTAGGVLSGTPTVANTFNFTITATDTIGATGAQAYTVIVSANQPPVPGAVSVERYPSQSTKVPISQITGAATDPDPGDTISLVSVANGANGTAQIIGGIVFYQPNANFQSTHTFTYIIQDNHGATANGSVTVTVKVDNAPSQNITKVTVQGNGSVAIDFAGIPGFTYGLQYTPTLAPATWVTLGPVTTNAVGAGHAVDGPPPTGTTSGFYRLVFPYVP